MPITRNCPTCHGDGETWEDTTDSRWEHTTRHICCADCDGTGTAPDGCRYECNDCDGHGYIGQQTAAGYVLAKCTNHICSRGVIEVADFDDIDDNAETNQQGASL